MEQLGKLLINGFFSIYVEKMKMPQICKCRIVNFRYNGGKRLIADELFDFGCF